MFRRGYRITKWCVHHHHPFAGGILDIHIIDTNTGAANNAQLGRRGQNFRRYLGRRPNGQPIIIANNRNQLLGAQARLHINIHTAFGEDVGGPWAQFVADQYAWFLIFGGTHFVSPVVNSSFAVR